MSENFEFESDNETEDTALLESMHEEWLDLFSSLNIKHDKAEKYFTELVTAYNEPERFYHNLEHISRMLKRIELFSERIEDVAILKLAIWYHDVVYDTSVKDNEEQSAILAESVLSDLGIDHKKIEKIKDFIITTKEHEISLDDSFDFKLLMDIDLEILGSSWENFEKYRKDIRKEYSWVPDDEYIDGTRNFFEDMLAKDKIYHTKEMYNELEEQARQNIKRALTEL